MLVGIHGIFRHLFSPVADVRRRAIPFNHIFPSRLRSQRPLRFPSTTCVCCEDLGYYDSESYGISYKVRGLCNDLSNIDIMDKVRATNVFEQQKVNEFDIQSMRSICYTM